MKLLMGISGGLILVLCGYAMVRGRFPLKAVTMGLPVCGAACLAAAFVPQIRGKWLAGAALTLSLVGAGSRIRLDAWSELPLLAKDGMPLFAFTVYYAPAVVLLLFCVYAMRRGSVRYNPIVRVLTVLACTVAVGVWIWPNEIEMWKIGRQTLRSDIPVYVDGEFQLRDLEWHDKTDCPITNLAGMLTHVESKGAFTHATASSWDLSALYHWSNEFEDPKRRRNMRIRKVLFAVQLSAQKVILMLHVALLPLFLFLWALAVANVVPGSRLRVVSRTVVGSVTLAPALLSVTLFAAAWFLGLVQWRPEFETPAVQGAFGMLAAILAAILAGRVLTACEQPVSRTDDARERQAAV